jgi:hypothetical protein
MPIGRDYIYEHLGKDLHLKAPNFWFAVAAGKKECCYEAKYPPSEMWKDTELDSNSSKEDEARRNPKVNKIHSINRIADSGSLGDIGTLHDTFQAAMRGHIHG